MSDNFFYQTKYKLDKAYYRECFEQSSPSAATVKDYYKAIALTSVGALLVVATDINPYASWFIFILGLVEALGVKYKKPWWVTRQMLSRAANNTVELTIDKHGFTTTLTGQKQHISWSSLQDIKQTPKGWILITEKGRQYLSGQHLSADVCNYLNHKRP